MAGVAQTGAAGAFADAARPGPRPGVPRAVAGLAVALVVRLMREGLVVRALAWPGVLTALSMFVSASVTIAWRMNPAIAVADSALVAPMEAEGLEVTVTDDPKAAMARGDFERAVWREGERWILGVTWGGYQSLKAESALRRFAGERWQIEVPEPKANTRQSQQLRPVTRVLAGIVALLFSLYGVVIGAGALYRDRSSGVLESDLALAVPRWTHAAARVVAMAAVLGPALVVSLLVIDVLVPLPTLERWMSIGFLSSLCGGALGFFLMARADVERGFSGPLSQALTAVFFLVSLGVWYPALGRFLPLVSLGTALAGEATSAVVVVLVTLAGLVALCVDFQHRECL